MFDTIEHLFDPGAVLQAVANALTAGGVLAVSTPNFDAASRFLLGEPWAVLSPLEHVYYFTEDSLRRILLAVRLPRRAPSSGAMPCGARWRP